jgi:transposase
MQRMTDMRLKQTTNKQNDRIYLSISHGYRDKKGKVQSKHIESLGYLDVLQKTIDDPIAYYSEYAKKLNEEFKAKRTYTITINANDSVERGVANVKNYGYIALSKIYYELELDRFFNNARRHEHFKFNSESIMRLLVYSRVIYPNSKKKTTEIKDRFFENFKFALYDVYDCLTHFKNCAVNAQRHMYQKIQEQYEFDTSLIYYDVTNYYFETDKQDGYRMNGCGKDKRGKPIIQFGLAMDARAIPMAYRTFKGNTHDSQTLMEALKSIKTEYNVGRAIVVADKGLNCGDNIAFNVALGDGYVFSQTIAGGGEELQAYVLEENGYSEPTKEGFKIKSRVIPATVKITVGTTKSGNKSKKTVEVGDQKQVVFYSPKYAARAKNKREEKIIKAQQWIEAPGKYNQSQNYGAAAYIENIKYDKDGEILEDVKSKLILNIAKIEEEEKYDGYYAVITSEADADNMRIVEIYKDLWMIEDTFKISKSLIRTRPIYVSKGDHIDGHFLTCYIALTLVRLLELRLGNKFTVEQIVETLRDVTCCHMSENLYLFNYANEITDAINESFGTDIGKKYMKLEEIRSSIAITKKKADKKGGSHGTSKNMG